MADTISKQVLSIQIEVQKHGDDKTFHLEEYIKKQYPSLLRIPRSKINQKLVDISSQLKAISNEEDVDQRDSLIAQEKIWTSLLFLRKELYGNPKYPIEANVAEAGAFSVSKRRKKAPSSGIVERKGRTATIRHYAGSELTVADAKVLLAIQKLWEEKGKAKDLEVTLYEIAKKLNRQVGGKTYSDIKDSLLSLFRAEVKFEDFFLNGERVKTQYIHLLEGVTEFDGDEKKVKVSFTDYVYKSLLSGYFIYVSMALLEDLSSSAAQGLYPFIALQTARGATEWYVEELYTLVNIASERPARRRKSLEEAFEDLQKSQIILDFRFYTDESDSEKVVITPSSILNNCLPPQSTIDASRQLSLPLFDQA